MRGYPDGLALTYDGEAQSNMRRVIVLALVLLLIAGSSLYFLTPTQPVAPKTLHDLTIPAGDPNWRSSCQSAALPDTSPGCEHAALFDLNLARTGEGLPKLDLPRGFLARSQASQLHFLIDNERTIRNLPAVPNSTPQLEKLASQAAYQARDPSIPPTMDGGSDWAGNFPNALVVDFMWMYEDGYRYTNGGGGSNLDCQSPKASGCWGHRYVILENTSTDTNYGTAFTTQLTPSQALTYADSFTLILAGEPAPFAINTQPLARTIVIIAVIMIIAVIISSINRRRRLRAYRTQPVGPPLPKPPNNTHDDSVA
jgi:hypothetical protein